MTLRPTGLTQRGRRDSDVATGEVVFLDEGAFLDDCVPLRSRSLRSCAATPCRAEQQRALTIGSVSPMAACRITCVDGGTIDVRGELEEVVDELHKVFTRREHTFAILHDLSGTPVAVRPEAVLHVRPSDAVTGSPERDQ